MVDLAAIAACLVLGADPLLVSAVMQHESAGRVAALNINGWEGEAFTVDNTEQATVAANQFINEGYTVDVGLMQINSKNLERFGEPVALAYEPCNNPRLGERILIENIATARLSGLVGDAAIRGALSLYNTGSLTAGIKNGYVDKLWRRYRGEDIVKARKADSRVVWIHGKSWSAEVSEAQHLWSTERE